MSKDYKEEILHYVTKEKFDKWAIKDSHQVKLLTILGVSSYEDLENIFVGKEKDNHLLKFLWYKLLANAGMPLRSFDSDKSFFNRLKNIENPSDLIENWQRKYKSGWSADTANSYAQLFKISLLLFLPEIFNNKNHVSPEEYKSSLNVRFKMNWWDKFANKIKETKVKYQFQELQGHLSAIHNNQVSLYSYLIFFKGEIVAELEKVSTNEQLQQLIYFAKLTHTPGNFILVQKGENVRKNKDYGDFMDLYIREQSEDYIGNQKLDMYSSPLFKRRGSQIYPGKEELFTCIASINQSIVRREEILRSEYGLNI